MHGAGRRDWLTSCAFSIHAARRPPGRRGRLASMMPPSPLPDAVRHPGRLASRQLGEGVGDPVGDEGADVRQVVEADVLGRALLGR